MTFWAKVVAIGVIIAAILGSYWYTYNAGVRHENDKQIIATAKANEIASKNFDTIWDLYIAEQNKKAVAGKVIRQKVEKIVERPVYKNVCLDDEGFNLANEAIRGGK